MQASQSPLSALWTEAQELANEALHVVQTAWDVERAELEKLRIELSSAFETQGTELEALRLKLAEVEKGASTDVEIPLPVEFWPEMRILFLYL
jgi:colicin import membrane protein